MADVIQQPGEPRLSGPGLRLAYNGPDARVYANDRALPRVFLVGAQLPVSGEAAALRAIERPGFDARRFVVTERPLPGLPSDGSVAGARPPGSARFRTYRPERVVLEARAGRPAELVLSDVSFPGWEVTVDGRRAHLAISFRLMERIIGRESPGTWRSSRSPRLATRRTCE